MPSAEKLAAMSDEELIDGAQAEDDAYTAAWVQEACKRMARRRWTIPVDVRPLAVSVVLAAVVLVTDRIRRRSDG